MFQDNSNIFLINPGHEFHAKLSIVSATYDTRTHKILSATVFVPSKTLRETRVFPRLYDPSTHTFPLLEIEPTRDRFRKSNLPAIEEAKLAVHLSSSFAFTRFSSVLGQVCPPNRNFLPSGNYPCFIRALIFDIRCIRPCPFRRPLFFEEDAVVGEKRRSKARRRRRRWIKWNNRA